MEGVGNYGQDSPSLLPFLPMDQRIKICRTFTFTGLSQIDWVWDEAVVREHNRKRRVPDAPAFRRTGGVKRRMSKSGPLRDMRAPRKVNKITAVSRALCAAT